MGSVGILLKGSTGTRVTESTGRLLDSQRELGPRHLMKCALPPPRSKSRSQVKSSKRPVSAVARKQQKPHTLQAFVLFLEPGALAFICVAYTRFARLLVAADPSHEWSSPEMPPAKKRTAG